MSPNVAVHVDTQQPVSVGEPSPGSARSAGSKRNSPAVNKLLSPDLSISPAGYGETGQQLKHNIVSLFVVTINLKYMTAILWWRK